jgi:hypothetical protein
MPNNVVFRIGYRMIAPASSGYSSKFVEILAIDR